MGNIDLIEALRRAWDIFKIDPLRTVVAGLVACAVSLTVILAPLAMAGFHIYTRKLARNENADIMDVLQPFSDFRRFFVGGLVWLLAYALAGIIISVSGFLSLLLFIAFTGLLLLYLPRLAFTNEEGLDVLRDCVEFFKRRWPMAVSTAVTINLLCWVGRLLLFVGLLVAVPFSLILTYVCYEQVYGIDDSGMVYRGE